MASQIQTVQQKVNTVGKHLMDPRFIQQLKYALPRAGVTPERMARIVLTEIRRTPKLADCSVPSLLGAVMQCAQLGLEPGPMGLAWIIPYGDEAQFQVGYKGLLNLTWRSEQISSVQSEVVYEKDHFTYSNGIPPELRHVPAEGGDRGKPTHVYAVVGTKAGGWIFRVMTAEEVNEHRKQHSKAGKSGKPTPWDTAWDEMACKTVLKRTLKRAPVSTEVQNALSLDDRAELGVPQEIDVSPAAEEESEPAAALPESTSSDTPKPAA